MSKEYDIRPKTHSDLMKESDFSKGHKEMIEQTRILSVGLYRLGFTHPNLLIAEFLKKARDIEWRDFGSDSKVLITRGIKGFGCIFGDEVEVSKAFKKRATKTAKEIEAEEKSVYKALTELSQHIKTKYGFEAPRLTIAVFMRLAKEADWDNLGPQSTVQITKG